MDLQKMKPLVDRFDQPHFLGQQVDRPDPTGAS